MVLLSHLPSENQIEVIHLAASLSYSLTIKVEPQLALAKKIMSFFIFEMQLSEESTFQHIV